LPRKIHDLNPGQNARESGNGLSENCIQNLDPTLEQMNRKKGWKCQETQSGGDGIFIEHISCRKKGRRFFMGYQVISNNSLFFLGWIVILWAKKLGRWVAKLVAHLLATAALWVRIKTSPKNKKMGDIQ
jgi:hypothetical protein